MLAYDQRDVIVEWEPANATTLVDVCVEGQTNRVLRVDAWKVLYVKVWIRIIHRDTPFASVSHWQHTSSFVVENWDQVFTHFQMFYGSAGIVNRFKWEVETRSKSTLGWFS